MIEVSSIPDSWKQVLETIQRQCPSAVIAGGALRDLHFGKPVKDIDVFIAAGGIDEAEGLFKLLGGKPPKSRDYGLQDIDGQPAVYPESMREVILVEDYPKKLNPTGIPVQLIFVNWQTASIIERFDMGICRISFDGIQVKHDRWFTEASEEKVLNIVRCQHKNALGASIGRYVRLLKKYPDFELRLCGVEVKDSDNES